MLEAIDEALSSLGESPKTAIYYHLEKAFQIRRLEIPERVEDFSSALERLFGLGAKHLEILFMRRLYFKVVGVREGVSREWVLPELTFVEYVSFMRRSFEEAGKNEAEMGILSSETEELHSCN